MRLAFNGVIRDQRGNVVASATVIVYEADTTTPATIYDAKSGGSAVSGASMTTGSDGSFLFYVDDSDYTAGSQFDIVASKTGYDTQTYSDVHVF